MSYIIETDNFKLKIEPELFQDSNSCLVNTIIESSGYIGIATLDVNFDDFIKFVQDIKIMNETLKGEANLTEQFGQKMCINFSAQNTGIIKVQGYMYSSQNGNVNKLFFENEFEPTYLDFFVSKLENNFEQIDSGY